MENRKRSVEKKLKAMENSRRMGDVPIGRLLLALSLPAMAGQMIMVFYNLVDRWFVAKYCGLMAVGAVGIVSPVNMLISVIGLAIGIGGGAMLVRSLGREDYKSARRIFGSMMSFVFVVSMALTVVGYIFIDPVLDFFGAEGNLLEPSRQFYRVIMIGAPLLSLTMTMNHSLRNEGKAIFPMFVMAFSAILNIVLDYLFIVRFGWGLEGAASATVIAQGVSFAVLLGMYLSGNTTVHLRWRYLGLRWNFIREVTIQSIPPYIRQAAIFIVSMVMNHVLYRYGGDEAVAAYGIVGSIIMLAVFIFIGLAQGALPIIGYNYGAQKFARVRETVVLSLKTAWWTSLVMTAFIEWQAGWLIELFRDDPKLLAVAVPGLRIICATIPLAGIQNIGAFYFQAIGQAGKSLVLTVSRQLFVLIPLLIMLFMPFDGLDTGWVWASMPFGDSVAAIVTVLMIIPAWKALLMMENQPRNDSLSAV